MKKQELNQSGTIVIVLTLILLLLTVAAFAVYRIRQINHNRPTPTNSSPQ